MTGRKNKWGKQRRSTQRDVAANTDESDNDEGETEIDDVESGDDMRLATMAGA